MKNTDVADKTIEDFGEQWTRFVTNEGFYGSKELFQDIVGPSIGADEIAGNKVLEVGSGTGRIVAMLVACGAQHVTAVEPSKAFQVLTRNVEAIRRQSGKEIVCLQQTGDRMELPGRYDAAFAIGVLHHIPDPDPVLRKVHDALQPGGKFVAWLYGREGNGPYLLFVEPLRKITKRLPDAALMGVVWLLYLLLLPYRQLCRIFPLPLANYIANVLFRMTPANRRLVIYDQLNPAYAKYYTREEAFDLFRRGGFSEIAVHSRRGYSWIAVGKK